MSFDVFAQAFRDGGAAVGDAVAARAVLSGVQYTHDPQFDSYDINFPDGSHLEMDAEGLDGRKPFDGAMFSLRGISDAVGGFIFSFTRAAGFVLVPAMEPASVLLTNESQAQHLAPDLANDLQVIVISSGAEVLAALQGGYDSWRAYRDRVVGQSESGSSGEP